MTELHGAVTQFEHSTVLFERESEARTIDVPCRRMVLGNRVVSARIWNDADAVEYQWSTVGVSLHCYFRHDVLLTKLISTYFRNTIFDFEFQMHGHIWFRVLCANRTRCKEQSEKLQLNSREMANWLCGRGRWSTIRMVYSPIRPPSSRFGYSRKRCFSHTKLPIQSVDELRESEHSQFRTKSKLKFYRFRIQSEPRISKQMPRWLRSLDFMGHFYDRVCVCVWLGWKKIWFTVCSSAAAHTKCSALLR